MSFVPERHAERAPPIETLRVPPHSIDAEQAVLGGLMLAPDALDKVADRLAEGDFYRKDHRLIWRAINELANKGMPCDAVTLGDWFEANGLAEMVGGASYLVELANATPSAANIAAYAEIVREKSVLRQLIDAGTSITEDGYRPEGKSVHEVLESAEQRVFHIAESGARGKKDSVSMREAVKDAFRLLHERYQNRGQLTGVSTGFSDLDELTSGLQPSDLIIVAARPSMGKAQPLDARVRTLGGWKRMGELEIGDALASVDGAPSMVVGVFPQGERQVYRVRFSDGRSTECCDEHLWRVHYRAWAAPRILKTGEIRTLLTRRRYQKRLWIDLADGHFGHAQALPVDSWVLGALLGDGALGGTAVRFSVKEKATLERMQARVGDALELHHAGQYDWRIVRATGDVEKRAPVNPLMHELKQLGLWDCTSYDKFIPRIYLDADRPQRLDLLRGLLDTDGWVEPWGTVRFSSASIQLAQDVCELVRSLGGWCTMSAKRTSYTYRGERRDGVTAYVCTISHPDPASLFLFEGKHERLKQGRMRRKFPVIESIEPTRRTATQCIAVSHPSHLYITDDYVVTHNTAFSVNIAEAVALRAKKAVAVFSMEMSASQLAFRLISSVGRIHQQHLRNGDLAEEDWPRVTNAIALLSEAKIYIDDTPGLSPVELRSRARRLHREHGGLGLIVIDYLQLMQVPGNKENRATEISEISRSLKGLAKELNVPVIALSQLNRSLEQRADKRPMMSDLRESGAIEQDADVIMFIYRDDYYNKESADKGLAEIIIGKQRNGPTDTVKLTFLGHYTKFENYAPDSFVGAFE